MKRSIVLCALGALLTVLSACGAQPAVAPTAAPAAPAEPAAPVAPAAGAVSVEQPWARAAVMTGEGQMMGAAATAEGGMAHGGATAEGGMAHGGEMNMGSTSAVYMTLVNNGSTADAVVKASTDAAQTVELHNVIMENNVAMMRPVPEIEIPAGGQAELKPGGFHVMLIGITRDLKVGDTVNLTLDLRSGASLQVAAPVLDQAP